MFGFFLIGLVIVCLSGILFAVAGWANLKSKNYEDQISKLNTEEDDLDYLAYTTEDFEDRKEILKRKHDFKEQRDKLIKKRNFWWTFNDSAWKTFREALLGIGLVVLLIVMIVRFVISSEVESYKKTLEMYDIVYETAKPEEKIALASKKMDMNKWLVDARASQEVFGKWSIYSLEDLSDLKYIGEE